MKAFAFKFDVKSDEQSLCTHWNIKLRTETCL